MVTGGELANGAGDGAEPGEVSDGAEHDSGGATAAAGGGGVAAGVLEQLIGVDCEFYEHVFSFFEQLRFSEHSGSSASSDIAGGG